MSDDEHGPGEHDLEEAMGEDGRYLPLECIVCHEDTQLRCGGCRHPICHHHEACPNGCDELPDSAFDQMRLWRDP